MKKVNIDEFFKMPSGTLYSKVEENSCVQDNCLYIKMDNGRPSGDHYIFCGAINLTPRVVYNGVETKYLYDYKCGDEIKSEIDYSDESSADFYEYDEVLVYDKEEVERIITMLQKICIENYGKDIKTLEKFIP